MSSHFEAVHPCTNAILAVSAAFSGPGKSVLSASSAFVLSGYVEDGTGMNRAVLCRRL